MSWELRFVDSERDLQQWEKESVVCNQFHEKKAKRGGDPKSPRIWILILYLLWLGGHRNFIACTIETNGRLVIKSNRVVRQGVGGEQRVRRGQGVRGGQRVRREQGVRGGQRVGGEVLWVNLAYLQYNHCRGWFFYIFVGKEYRIGQQPFLTAFVTTLTTFLNNLFNNTFLQPLLIHFYMHPSTFSHLRKRFCRLMGGRGVFKNCLWAKGRGG